MSITTLSFFDLASETISYVLSDGQHAAVIDSVLDFDATSGSVSTRSADRIIDAIESRGLKVQWILETHAHTDHLSAASYLKLRLGGQIAIGENICQVQRIFKRLYNLEPGFLADGSPFDRLLKDGESFRVGGLEVTALLILVVAALMARPIRSDLADARPQPARRRGGEICMPRGLAWGECAGRAIRPVQQDRSGERYSPHSRNGPFFMDSKKRHGWI